MVLVLAISAKPNDQSIKLPVILIDLCIVIAIRTVHYTAITTETIHMTINRTVEDVLLVSH
jgi:hypothetical protein